MVVTVIGAELERCCVGAAKVNATTSRLTMIRPNTRAGEQDLCRVQYSLLMPSILSLQLKGTCINQYYDTTL